jgi:hypothetical protein
MLVAIIAILVGLVLPFLARSKGRPHGPEIKCRNNLKNIGLAFRIYVSDNNDEFPQTTMLRKGLNPEAAAA